MGHQPRRDPGSPPAALYGPQIRSPDRESFHLHMARLAYVEGCIDVDEFERAIAHVLGGGYLNSRGRISAEDPLTPPAPFMTETLG
jgi:hypothetical protein